MADRSTGTPRSGAERPAKPPGGDETAVRPRFKERVEAAVSRATEEHKANATAEKGDATSVGQGRAAPAREDSTRRSTPVPRTAASQHGGRVRRARLRLTRVDPWSVMKTAFLLSVAFAIVTVVSVFIVWSVLGAAGVWESINAAVSDVIGGEEASGFDIENYLGMSRVLGFTMLVAVVDIILLTAIATLGAFLYNMAAALLGGVEVTLTEDPR